MGPIKLESDTPLSSSRPSTFFSIAHSRSNWSFCSVANAKTIVLSKINSANPCFLASFERYFNFFRSSPRENRPCMV